MTATPQNFTDRKQSTYIQQDIKQRLRYTFILVAALLLLMGGLICSLRLGSVWLSMDDLIAVWQEADTTSAAYQIIWNLRLPRLLVGALVGMNLAMSGVLLQAVMRNPLAGPNIVGITAGAGLAATIVLVLIPGWPMFLPVLAMIGAMSSGFTVYVISWRPGIGTSPIRMILAGVAITAVLGAFTTFLMVIYAERVGSVVLWMSGSLNARSWHHFQLLWPYSVIGLFVSLFITRTLNVLQLGDDMAKSLGMRVEWARGLALIVASLLAGSAVSVAGMIGFVGLMIPHITRMLCGNNHAKVLPLAAVLGTSLIVWGDLLSRTALSPTELPVGIITALIGGPYFIFLLYKTKAL
ncbi:MAG: FecCD family ABC transporter permease [Phycisphaeraceae bacterium JB051]